MKKLFFILLNLFPFLGIAQETEESVNKNIRAAHVQNDHNKIGHAYQTASLFYYDRDADRSILYQDSAIVYFSKPGNKALVAISNQNIAFVYDEKKHQPEQTIPYINKAMDIWIDLKDTINLANMLKYLGLIQSQLHEYTIAKSNIKKAVELFRAKRYISGEAVCYYNLGKVYNDQEMRDSAIAMFYKSRDIWYQLKVYPRIFNINNELIIIYTKKREFDKIEALIDDNEKHLKKDIYWQHRLESFQVVADYYKIISQENRSNAYKKRYEKFKEKLKRKGIAV